MKTFFKEKMASSLFIQIDIPNLNVIQNNKAISRLVPPSLSLAPANKIRRITSNEIQANYIIKGGQVGKMVCWILAAHNLDW